MITTLRKYFLSLSALLLLALGACSRQDAKYTESTEETTAEIEAAMMMGKSTAKKFVNKEWNDSLELINNLLEAKAVQSKYLIDHKPRSAEAFDTAFITTVRAVNPELALRIVTNYPPKEAADLPAAN